ncbi:MAG: hypothetical protein ABSG82_05375 [Sedimentisphaerales bacterium]|jgi:methionyl-tRNA formyltransferase
MNNSADENLRELLSGFMDAEAAGRAAEEIESGDELLRAHPAPQPSEAFLAEIKKKMSAATGRRQTITLRRRILAVAAAAAVIVAVSAVTLKFFEKQPVTQTTAQYAAAIPAKIWESNDITADDADIVVLAAEVGTIENELSGVQLNDNSGNGSGAVGDLEMELIETNGDFWKG